LENLAISPIQQLTATALTAPTPGIVISRLECAFSSADFYQFLTSPNLPIDKPQKLQIFYDNPRSIAAEIVSSRDTGRTCCSLACGAYFSWRKPRAVR
jgi:hypothetical protein